MTRISTEHEDYFTSELPDNYRKYRNYGNYPRLVIDKKLRPDEYEGIIHEFMDWIKRDLNAEYVPAEDIVRKELLLIKAEYSADKKEDMAFLGDIISEIQGRKAGLRMVQTGGLNSGIYFFVHYPAFKMKMSTREAGTILLDTINGLLNNPSGIEAQIEEISGNGGIVEVHKKPVERWTHHLQTFQGFLFGNTVCFDFRKDTFAGDDWDVPAKEPQPNEWFEYHKNRK